MAGLNQIMTKSVQIGIAFEEFIGLNDDITTLNVMRKVMAAKGGEYTVYADELEDAIRDFTILISRTENKFDECNMEDVSYDEES